MILVELLYILSAVLFALSLRWMGEVKTSRRGNSCGIAGMILAVAATVVAVGVQHYAAIIAAIAVGGIIGAVMALKMPMTAVPQRTAISHAFGALAAALVGTAEYLQYTSAIDRFTMAILALEVILGFVTFTGSIIAFAKLQEIIPGRPIVYPLRRVISVLILGGALALGVYLIIDPSQTMLFWAMSGLSLVFGIILVIAIGGADMPTVIAILNAFAGLSAAGLGFVLNNKLLIVAGALDGSSGLILAVLMCKAMNRSFLNVLFGGFGAVADTSNSDSAYKDVKSTTPEEVATILDNAQSVIVVPGYGMAVAQAQNAVRDLMNLLEKKNIHVQFAIHPVAGRMPGHMNVLLAEANIPYDKLKEMDSINSEFSQTDVVIVVGANDVVNPAASTDKGSPIYGMPILNVHEARTVVVIKRSLSPGFAGVKNELFERENCLLLFTDAKEGLTGITHQLKEL